LSRQMGRGDTDRGQVGNRIPANTTLASQSAVSWASLWAYLRVRMNIADFRSTKIPAAPIGRNRSDGLLETPMPGLAFGGPCTSPRDFRECASNGDHCLHIQPKVAKAAE
jgi:hypothetical protein